jgi:uncharacterized protein (TIGR03083 family)
VQRGSHYSQRVIDVTAAYQQVADRFAATILELTEQQAAAAVRSCPGWAVRDVLAHHVGLTADFASGHAPEVSAGVDFVVLGAAFAHLAARQVSERASRSVSEIVAEWESVIPVTWAIMCGELPSAGLPIEPAVGQAVMINDVVVHEGDVRLALGLPLADETPALALALGNYALMASPRVQKAGLSAIRLEYDGREKIVGTGDPILTLRGPRNDLVRTIASRRSREQILAMDWDGDPTDYVDVLPVYGAADPADADLT